MFKPKPFFKVFTETGPLIVLGVTIAILVAVAAPASAQFFNFGNFGGPPRPAPRSNGGFGGGGWFGGDFFSPFQPQQAPKRVYQDFSKPPPPEKRETVAERNVLVLGDGMADWLASGLESAYAEQPEMGVIRKVKSTSGLIQYQPKGPPADWAAAARDILATERPDVVVVMLGLNDRIQLREPGDLRTRFVFTAARDARGAAVIFDQRLPRGKIHFVQPHRRLKFLARFLCQRQSRKHARVLRLASIGPAEPFVVHRIFGFQCYRLFCAGDCRIVLLRLAVSFRQQQVDFAVLGTLGHRVLQKLSGLGIVTGFIRPPARLDAFILFRACGSAR